MFIENSILLYYFPLIISSLFFLLFYKFKIINFFLNIEIYLKDDRYKKLFLIFSAFIILFTIEDWILGKSSHFKIYDSGDGLFPFSKRIAEKSLNLIIHDISGGIFRTAAWFNDSFFNINTIFLKIFNPYLGSVFLKIFIYFLSLLGGFLLLNSLLKNKILCILSAIILCHAHQYSNPNIFVHGLGYTSIPLTIYLCYFYRTKILFKLFIIFIYCLLLSVSSSLPHSIVAQLSSVIVFWLYLLQDKNNNIFERSLIALYLIILLIIFSILNNFEFIQFSLLNGDNFARSYFSELFVGSTIKSFKFAISKIIFGEVWMFVYFILLIYSLLKKHFFIFLSLTSPFLLIEFVNILANFKFLSFFSAIRFETILFSLPTIILYSAIYFFFNSIKNKSSIISIVEFKNSFYLLLYIAFSLTFYFKYSNFIEWVSDGSYLSNYELNPSQKQFLIDEKIIIRDDSLFLLTFQQDYFCLIKFTP